MILPLVASFGWAIRGQSGYGAVPGCIFAGTLIACAWFFLSAERKERQGYWYRSGWVIFALIAGIGIGGMHGWSQWGNWVQGRFIVRWAPPQEIYSIHPAWGYTWWFVAAVPWAGMGAVLLAWTHSKHKMKPRDWIKRLACGGAGIGIAALLFHSFTALFVPYYGVAPFGDPVACPECGDAFHHNRISMLFMGAYLGFLAYEVYRKDWRSVKLILIVGIVTGVLWCFNQFWQFMDDWFPGVSINWWRCWESSAGFSIGLAFAIAFSITNKPDLEHDSLHARGSAKLIGLNTGLMIGLSWSVYSGIGGFIGILKAYPDPVVSPSFNSIPISLVGAIMFTIPLILHLVRKILLLKRSKKEVMRFLEPMDNHLLLWLFVAIVQGCLGFLVTGPYTVKAEIYFAIYYAVIWTVAISSAVTWERMVVKKKIFKVSTKAR